MRNQPALTRNGLKKAKFCSKSELNRCINIPKHVNMIFYDYFSVFYLSSVHFSIPSSYGKSFGSFVYVIIYCVGEGISTLISISDWSDPYILRRKMQKTQSVKEKIDGKMFISARVGILLLHLLRLKYFSLLCTVTWRVNSFVFHQGNGLKKRNESSKGKILIITLFISWLYWLRLVVYSKE